MSAPASALALSSALSQTSTSIRRPHSNTSKYGNGTFYTQQRQNVLPLFNGDGILDLFMEMYPKLTMQDLEKLSVLGYFACEGGMMYLLHPKRPFYKDQNVSYFKGLVLVADITSDANLTLREAARSLPLPVEERDASSFTEKDLSDFSNVIEIQEGTYIRFFYALGRYWASTNKDLDCLDHRWIENSLTFGEAIKKIKPDFIDAQDVFTQNYVANENSGTDSYLSGPDGYRCVTYLLRTNETSLTNKIEDEYFKRVHEWEKLPNNKLIRLGLHWTFKEAQKLLSNSKLGIFVYNTATNEVIAFNTDLQNKINTTRGDNGNLIVRYIELRAGNDDEQYREFLDSYRHRSHLFTEFEMRERQILGKLVNFWRRRYVNKKFVQLKPNVHHFVHSFCNNHPKYIEKSLNLALCELESESPYNYYLLVDAIFKQ